MRARAIERRVGLERWQCGGFEVKPDLRVQHFDALARRFSRLNTPARANAGDGHSARNHLLRLELDQSFAFGLQPIELAVVDEPFLSQPVGIRGDRVAGRPERVAFGIGVADGWRVGYSQPGCGSLPR